MIYKLKKTVVLVGMMGSGKSAIGRGFANRLNVNFVDLDQEIIDAANLEIIEIFDIYGENFFREKETKILERLILGPPIVLASGGGVFISEKNRSLILKHANSIWLNSDCRILWNRIKHRRNRPLLNNCKNFQDFEKIYSIREDSYKQADICVFNDQNYSIEEIIEITFNMFCDFDEG